VKRDTEPGAIIPHRRGGEKQGSRECNSLQNYRNLFRCILLQRTERDTFSGKK